MRNEARIHWTKKNLLNMNLDIIIDMKHVGKSLWQRLQVWTDDQQVELLIIITLHSLLLARENITRNQQKYIAKLGIWQSDMERQNKQVLLTKTLKSSWCFAQLLASSLPRFFVYFVFMLWEPVRKYYETLRHLWALR